MAFQELGLQNPDGWGMGWYDQAGPRIYKEPLSAADSEKFEDRAIRATSEAFICHVRKATCGAVDERNCHPFQFNNWLFAHNGSVERQPLLESLENHHVKAIEGKTDSEVLFHSLLQEIEKQSGGVFPAVTSTVNAITKYSSLNFILTDGNYLYAYRDATKNLEYYSLFYLLRDPEDVSPDTLRSKELNALLRCKQLREEKAVLICSERLTDEAWEEIPVGHLLIVSSDLVSNLMKVK
jgi:glutamine amidotransferase